MLLDLRIKVEQPFLGNKRTREQVRRFQKEELPDSHLIIIDSVQWYWALQEAAKCLSLDVNVHCIRFKKGFRAPTLVLYTRRWHHQNSERRQEEQFESIREGAELSIELILLSTPEPGQNTGKVPTVEEVEKLFQFVGESLGLSPWGSKFGYGRFRVLHLKKI
jgi:hypothetical protein